jgi:hypothetical protein
MRSGSRELRLKPPCYTNQTSKMIPAASRDGADIHEQPASQPRWKDGAVCVARQHSGAWSVERGAWLCSCCTLRGMQVAIARRCEEPPYWVVLRLNMLALKKERAVVGVAVKAGKRGLRTSLPSIFRLHRLEVIDWTRTAPLPSRVTGTGFPRFRLRKNETRRSG